MPAATSESGGGRTIRRRRILYVEGYDPQGSEGYFELFRRSFARFVKIWPIEARHGDLSIGSDDIAHWDVEAHGPNWRVETRYEFLRQERMIRANLNEPLWRIVTRAVGWTADYLLSGTIWRVYRASLQYGLALSFFQLGLLAWIAVSVIGGWLVAKAAFRLAGAPEWLAIGLGIIAAPALFRALLPLAHKLFLVQINSHWPHLLEYARGLPSCFDHAIDAGARRLAEIVADDDADEILLIGHSGGGVTAPAIMVAALERDPDIGRRGPKVVLLTLGSIMPGAALHPQARKLHDLARRLATEPSIRWIDTQSRKDALNFWNFDPVGGIGVDVGDARCNPTIWRLRFRDLLSDEFYQRIRTDFFRLHYQFIMANDRRAAYDYFMLVCGPYPVEAWVRDGVACAASFADDGSIKAPAGGAAP